MRKCWRIVAGLGLGIGMAAVPSLTEAHFVLMEPSTTLVQNQLGDPQKLGPCGGTSANKGIATGTISRVRGGAPLHITIRETIFHPGHYRVALAVNSVSELPPNPEAATRPSDRGPWSVSAPIQSPVQVPVLADGLFPHTTRPTDLFQADVMIPNITCKKCTLQITQFMAEHGVNPDGGFHYHHCADLAITADPAKPVDSAWPKDLAQ